MNGMNPAHQNTQNAPSSPSDNGDAPLEDMLHEIAGGLLYCHHRENANTSRLLEIGAFLYALLELATERGLLSMEEIEARKQAVGKRLAKRFLDKGMGVEIQDSKEDKYAFNGTAQIDCENRIHLCKAACCRMHFPLSQQDLQERVVRWDLSRPYVIAHDGHGYCTHLEHGSCRCTIYENRPLPCRAYDCRNDKRIWLDFEKQVVNPDLDNVFTPSTETQLDSASNR
jgi:hypothetical protein